MSTRRIAELAGVSPTTVSLALRDSPKIPIVTRRRILAVAKRLGYRPNAKIAELMMHLRLKRNPAREACFGVFSFYPEARPWENALHLQRIYEGMTRRAEVLGYRLEPFWLRGPGMTPRRLRSILDARGIQGLLCFGSPQLEEEMPPELEHYAIVTQGVSVKTPLHRVTSHAYNDMWRVLKNVRELGYKRPGLILGDYEGRRSAHAYLCVYLGWSHLVGGTTPAIPVLQLTQLEEEPLTRWYREHQPDVIIFAHHTNALADFERTMKRHGVRVPEDVGVAAVAPVLEGTRFSGLQGNQHLVGSWAVELLVGRIVNRDFGLPSHPRIEMVEMQWVEGSTLPRRET